MARPAAIVARRAIGLDLGGTRIRCACLDEHLNIVSRRETRTLADQGFETVMGRIRALIGDVLQECGASVTGIGVAAPGPLNPATGMLFSAGNLPGWENVPLAGLLQDTFHVPVYLSNDANAAAVAETMCGAARGCRNVIYLTLSTGIGSGIITDGRLLLGQQGIAAEAGFMLMLFGNTPSAWQDNASGPAIAEQARQRIAQGEQSLIRALANGEPERIDGQIIGQAARQGDALALDIVRRAGWLIGLGVANLVHLFNPQMVVLGGGVANMGELLFEPIRAAVREYCPPPYWEHLRITASELRDDAGLVGAAAAVFTSGGDLTQHLFRKD
jgi:glucokinase